MKIKLFPLQIQIDEKYYNLEWKDGKIITETNMEADPAAEALFEAWKKRAEPFIKAILSEQAKMFVEGLPKKKRGLKFDTPAQQEDNAEYLGMNRCISQTLKSWREKGLIPNDNKDGHQN